MPDFLGLMSRICPGSSQVSDFALFDVKDIGKLVFASRFLAHMTFAYNFFIYVIFNDIYRENVKTLLSKWLCLSCRYVNRVRDAKTEGAVGQELDEIG